MIFNETCQGVCYNDFVIGPPDGYNDAFFEVKNVKVFQNAAAIAANSTGNNSSTSTGSKNTAVGVGPTFINGGLLLGLLLQINFWDFI